jgi:hypothetical protein
MAVGMVAFTMNEHRYLKAEAAPIKFQTTVMGLAKGSAHPTIVA